MTAHVQNITPADHISDAERAIRVDLAACYRLVALYGWDDLIFTHISARIPGPEHHFLINPYGMMFEEITASSLVKVDLDGNQLTKSHYSINPAGFTGKGESPMGLPSSPILTRLDAVISSNIIP